MSIIINMQSPPLFPVQKLQTVKTIGIIAGVFNLFQVALFYLASILAQGGNLSAEMDTPVKILRFFLPALAGLFLAACGGAASLWAWLRLRKIQLTENNA